MITKEQFGTLPSGECVYAYSVTNASTTSFTVLNYGGILKNLFVADRNGKTEDVILGFDSLESYLTSGGCQGALIGRVANRIANASFTLEGTEYHLNANEGKNAIHGGLVGFHQKVWGVVETDGEEPKLTLTLFSPDGDENYPGNLHVTVEYKLTKDGALSIHYLGETDKTTLINMTNHSYFNLGGNHGETVNDHLVWLDSDRINNVDEGLIPDGKLLDVTGTPFDFRKETRLGDGFASTHPLMIQCKGYDNNFFFTEDKKSVVLRGTVTNPKNGIKLSLYTDEPCVQIYTGNMVNVNDPFFKGNIRQYPHCAACLETQAMPDAIHHPGMTNTVLRAGETYDTTTVFAFETV